MKKTIRNLISFFLLIFILFSNVFLPTICFAVEEKRNENENTNMTANTTNDSNTNNKVEEEIKKEEEENNNKQEETKKEEEEEQKKVENEIEEIQTEDKTKETEEIEKIEEPEIIEQETTIRKMTKSVSQRANDRIEDGIYEIALAKDINQLVTIDNNANAQIWQKSRNQNQKFQITYSNEGYYTIQEVNTKKVLDVYAGLKENGTNVQAYANNQSDAQKWIIKKENNGQYSILSKPSGLYLDIYAGLTANGTNIQIYEGNGSIAQRFIFNKVEELKSQKVIEDGVYEIASAKDTNQLITIDNNSNAQIWQKTNNQKQKFQVTYSNEGYYTIQEITTKKVLDVYAGLSENGTNVQAYENNQSKAQRWVIKKETNGEISIISKASELYIDIYAGETKNGSNIQIYEGNGSIAQRFLFKKVEQIKGEQSIKDGMYKIKSAVDPNMVLDVSGGNEGDFANIQIWEDSNVKQQKFHVKYIGNGFYTIRAVHSKKAVDVYAASKELGANVNQYTYNGGDAQQWIIKRTSDGYFNLISKCNYLYLDIYAGLTLNGTNVQMYEGNESKAQKFILEETEAQAIDDGTYKISMAINTNKLIEVNDSSMEDGANIQIWDDLDRNCQKFDIKYDAVAKEYTIQSVNSRKVLDVYAGLNQNGTNVQQYTSNNSKAQRWDIVDLGDGTYHIISKCNGLYLDVYAGSTNNKTNVQVYEGNGSKAQLFKFTKTTAKNEHNSNFAGINENKYPGYKEALEKLQEKYPNWIFTMRYTGLDWNDVVDKQDVVIKDKDGKDVPRSLTAENNVNWRNGTTQYGDGWYRASRGAIAYMMDPRNSLDDEYIFQFQDLSSSAGTYSDIAKMVSGTYLDDSNMINMILTISRQEGISPFHLVSRFIQEQGNSGWCRYGYLYTPDNGLTPRIVYNYGNVGATGNTNEEIIENGAQYAYGHKWFTPEMCIAGTSQFLTKNYIGIGQSTLYFQKYNVVTKDYSHQYMQNIRAANDEAPRIAQAYRNAGLIHSQFEFIIPVYENMPASKCPRP